MQLLQHFAVGLLPLLALDVFQVNTKLVTAAYSQAVNFVQPKPKLAVQITKASFVVIQSSEEIYRAISSLLKHRPSYTGCFLITEDFKFSQTIRTSSSFRCLFAAVSMSDLSLQVPQRSNATRWLEKQISSGLDD